MTTKRIDPEELHLYVGRSITAILDFGWDMNDWPESGVLRGVEDGYFYLQDERDDDEYEDFHDLGGYAIRCIREVHVVMRPA